MLAGFDERNWLLPVIDVHCHMAPGLDDGAKDLATAIAMARMAVVDGIEAVVCTPHVTPGIYDNSTETIEATVELLQGALLGLGISLTLYVGADVHIAPNLAVGLAAGSIPTIARSRYFLFEPPHHVVPPRLEVSARSLLAAGFIPILTHPERLTWIESHYDVVQRLSDMGVLVQLTAGSISGSFGKRAKDWSERLLEEGYVDLVATDAHNTSSRAPILSRARDIVAQRIGEAEAMQMVLGRPAAIISDQPVAARPVRHAAAPSARSGEVPRKVMEWIGNWRRH